MSDPEAIIRAELLPNERLIWAGRARTGIVLRAIDVFLLPFGVLWCGGLVYGLMSQIAQGGPDTVFAIVFISFMLLLGSFFLFGRWFVEAWRRARTTYGVTNERVIMVEDSFSRAVRSVNLDTTTVVDLSERKDGSGSIFFGPRDWFGGGILWLGLVQLPWSRAGAFGTGERNARGV